VIRNTTHFLNGRIRRKELSLRTKRGSTLLDGRWKFLVWEKYFLSEATRDPSLPFRWPFRIRDRRKTLSLQTKRGSTLLGGRWKFNVWEIYFLREAARNPSLPFRWPFRIRDSAGSGTVRRRGERWNGGCEKISFSQIYFNMYEWWKLNIPEGIWFRIIDEKWRYKSDALNRMV